ncbi:MAG: OmpA family protein [Saprospiraceae bacterium]|nr:OmpA family protein [Bacteroidia bacterium]NNF21115.1 OmpA family protein [Saprospiraceae bacterium]
MRLLIFVLWLLLGLVYWYFSDSCCSDTKTVSETTEIISQDDIQEDVSTTLDQTDQAESKLAADGDKEDIDASGTIEEKDGDEVVTISRPGKMIKKLTPIGFIKSSAEPVVDKSWVSFRDSLMNLIGTDQILQVEGMYFEDEVDGKKTDLGMARARNVLKLFSGLTDDKSELKSRSAGAEFTKDKANNLIAFRFLKRTKNIKEIDDRTLIYFPYNSTRQISNSEIEKYLIDLSNRLKQTGEKVRLIGHTDSFGSDSSNRLLGLWRAEVIRDYLVSKGISVNKISVFTKGESIPIASNKTESGRSKNRRVELQIIK